MKRDISEARGMIRVLASLLVAKADNLEAETIQDALWLGEWSRQCLDELSAAGAETRAPHRDDLN